MSDFSTINPPRQQPFRVGLVAAAFAGLSLLLPAQDPSGSSQSTTERRPNIVFILTDDQRSDSLACYGNPIIKTPNIDRLAAEGILFENAFVTSAICTPSRASYFLGQYERRHGVNFNSGTALSLEAWQDSYPMQLRAAGYFTGYVGKNHVPIGPQGYYSGVSEQSFDFWYAAHEFLFFYPKDHHPIFRQAKVDTQIEILGEGAVSFVDANESFIAGAKTFLQSRPPDQPFCLTVALNVPHSHGTSSMQMRPTDAELYRTGYRDQIDEIPLPATYIARADIRTEKIVPGVFFPEFRQSVYDYVNTPESLRERKVREYETITGVDQMVGRVRMALEHLGVAENTVIIFASDHGLMEGEFGLGGKALNYEPCLRIPMIVMDPRLPEDRRGRRESRFALSIDIAPTLLELGGVEMPATVQGRSLIPLLEGAAVDWRTYAFAENLWSTAFGNPRIESIRDAEWKYSRYFANDRSAGPGGGAGVPRRDAAAYRSWLTSSLQGEEPGYEELFHLAEDPHEENNLIDDVAYASVVARLRSELDREVRGAKGDLNADPVTVSLDASEQVLLRARSRAEARDSRN